MARELLAARRMIETKDVVVEMLAGTRGWDNPELDSALEAHDAAKAAWQESRK
jgi:hypothetical protein